MICCLKVVSRLPGEDWPPTALNAEPLEARFWIDKNPAAGLAKNPAVRHVEYTLRLVDRFGPVRSGAMRRFRVICNPVSGTRDRTPLIHGVADGLRARGHAVEVTPTQCADFDKHQRFIVEGADTGHRYMITSRHAPDELKRGAFRRTVYDLDEERAFCVHDWEIPAEEECLTMALLIQLPGRENYVRAIPEVI